MTVGFNRIGVRYRFFQMLHRARALKESGAGKVERRVWFRGYIFGHIDAYNKVNAILEEVKKDAGY